MPHVGTAVADRYDMTGDLRCPGARIRHRVVRYGVDFPDLLTRRRVQRMQTAVDRSHIHTTLPDGNTPVDQVAAGISGRQVRGARVVAPDLLAGTGVDRIHVTPRSGRIHHAVDHDGSRFLPAVSAEIVVPRKPEAADVLVVDSC